MKLSSVIMGMLFVVLIVSTFTIFITDVNTSSTQLNSEYDASKLASFNKSAELTEITRDINTSLFEVKEKSSIDLIGSFVSTAIAGLKAGIKSLSVANAMIMDVMNIFGLPSVFIYVLQTVLVLAGLFLIISAMLKWFI